MPKMLQESNLCPAGVGRSDGCRSYGRDAKQLRPLTITYDSFGYADSSVLLYIGNTKVLCSVTLQQGVPPFLRGKQTGWLNAEYAMLPTATTIRKQRDNSAIKPNGRSVEISRLIGRCLRSVVDVSGLGERTITIDCDVLQADGGTRTACISGAYIALKRAISCWIENGQIAPDAVVLRDEIAAVSVGLRGQEPLLDLDFAEDSTIDADFNFVMTKQGAIVEVQGTAEKQPISAEKFQEVCALATQGISQLFAFFESDAAQDALCSVSREYARDMRELGVGSARVESAQAKQKPAQANQAKNKHQDASKSSAKVPLFSLQNRLQNLSE